MPGEIDTVKKAQLRAVSPEDATLNIEFMFNSTELIFTKSTNWESKQGNRGKTLLPKINFSGVEPYKFTLSGLLFDTYETKEPVMKYINIMKRGVEAPLDAKAWRPPVYKFVWGEYTYCSCCVMTSLTYKLTMFLADGTPVRALVDISLQEVDPDDKFTPLSASKNEDRVSDPRSAKLGPVPEVQPANKRVQRPIN